MCVSMSFSSAIRSCSRAARIFLLRARLTVFWYMNQTMNEAMEGPKMQSAMNTGRGMGPILRSPAFCGSVFWRGRNMVVR